MVYLNINLHETKNIKNTKWPKIMSFLLHLSVVFIILISSRLTIALMGTIQNVFLFCYQVIILAIIFL